MKNHFINLFDNVRWVSMETDGWLTNSGNDSICVMMNLINKNMVKVTIPAQYAPDGCKKKEYITGVLKEVALENNMSHFLTSCCTDNASNVLEATDVLKDNNFSAFSVHPGCSIHQVQLFAKDMISDKQDILNKYHSSDINSVN